MFHSLNLPGSDKVPFLNCCKGGDAGNEGNGDNGPVSLFAFVWGMCFILP